MTSTLLDAWSRHGTLQVRRTCIQRCSLGLERLGLEAVSRRFLERLGLESLKKWNVSVLRVQRLGLVDMTSRSRSRDFSLVNIHARHHACGYIRKKIMDDPQETGCQVTDFTS